MTVDNGQLLLVGSVARLDDGWGVEDVFTNCARELGDRVSMLPDGELDDRIYWVQYVFRNTYLGHPDMVKLSRHTFEDWISRGYDDPWQFSIRDGVKQVRFDKLGYADAAVNSYKVFCELRDQGVIPAGVRFMVALPSIESATLRFIDTTAHFEILWEAYAEVVAREVATIAEAIPHEDLAIQWDFVTDVAAIEGHDDYTGGVDPSQLTWLPADPVERYRLAIERTCADIPSDVWVGLHICYGSLGKTAGANKTTDKGSFSAPTDLGTSTLMANEGVASAGRSIDFIHVPVPSGPGLKDSYYEPLKDLDVGDARVYLGLIHLHDGLDGTMKRIDVARRHIDEFGVGTVCGWGRRPADQSIEDLLELERTVADAMTAVTKQD